MLEALAVLLVLTAFFTWVNERTLKLPSTVGVALAGAASAIFLIALDELGIVDIRSRAELLLERLDFTEFFLGGILSVLLFAGALGLDARQVLRQRNSIFLLAVVSTLLSTALIGGAAYLVFDAFGIDLPLLYALLFGALISPTDPVAVLDMLKREKVPKRCWWGSLSSRASSASASRCCGSSGGKATAPGPPA
ncbi:MAG: cation:proton antiporter [Nocardioides sp.]